MANGKYEYWLTPDGLLLLEAWARDGLTDEQIALKMGINVATLYRYKQSYCEICDALKKGKEIVDIQVENALFKRAVGYEYEETKIIISEKDGRRVETVKKQMPPDTTAQIFWLKNRKPEKWRDRVEVQNNDNDQVKRFIEAMKNGNANK